MMLILFTDCYRIKFGQFFKFCDWYLLFVNSQPVVRYSCAFVTDTVGKGIMLWRCLLRSFIHTDLVARISHEWLEQS